MKRPDRRPALLANLRRQPDLDLALQRYARLADDYESATTRIREVRRRAIDSNAWVLWGARRYLTTWHGLRKPWQPLFDWCPNLQIVERFHDGTTYLAAGTVAPLPTGMREREQR